MSNENKRKELIKAWRRTKYPVMAAASRGEVTNSYNESAATLARNFGHLFKPKNNWNTKYLYRGLPISSPNRVKTTQGYSSWTNTIAVAQSFAAKGRPWNSMKNKPIVLRINTNLLKGVSVLNLTNSEREYVLPPMKVVLNSTYNGNFLPVREVMFNQRWAAKNKPVLIPRTFARRISPGNYGN